MSNIISSQPPELNSIFWYAEKISLLSSNDLLRNLMYNEYILKSLNLKTFQTVPRLAKRIKTLSKDLLGYHKCSQ